MPSRDFQCCPPIVKKRSATQHGSPTYSAKRSATQHGSPSYSAKSTLLSQKQRRYAYDSDVYAKNYLHMHACSLYHHFNNSTKLPTIMFSVLSYFCILIHYCYYSLFNYINDFSVEIMGITLRFLKFNYINGLSVKTMRITVRFVNYNR